MARRITPLSKMAPDARAKRIALLVGNPNTRAAVPDKYLSGGMLKQRHAAQAAKTPVVPGSSLTNGQLSQQAASATTVRYGDAANQTKQQVAQARQTEADTNGWYQDYLQKLAAHQGNVQSIGAQTTDAIRSLAQAAPVQGPDGTNTPDAQNAAAIRAAILGSSGAAQTTIAGNATRYADTLANVVGPGQKLSALAQARGNTTKAQDALKALMGQEGAYRDQFIAQGKADEAKNVLAGQALGLNAQKAAMSAAAGRATRRETRSYHQQQIAAKGQSVNQYGYTNADWQGMSTEQRRKIIADSKTRATTTKPVAPDKQYANDFYAKYGIKPATQQEVLKARNTVGSAGNWIRTVLSSNPGMNRAQLAQFLLNGQAPAAAHKDPATGKPVDAVTAIPAQPQLWLTVALDQHFMHGYISNGTADKLHHAGYSVKGLGLQTRGAPTGAAAYPTGQAPGGGH